MGQSSMRVAALYPTRVHYFVIVTFCRTVASAALPDWPETTARPQVGTIVSKRCHFTVIKSKGVRVRQADWVAA